MAERTQFRFGLVGYGEIGSTLGAGLRGAGLERITCYDKYAFDGPYADLIQGGRGRPGSRWCARTPSSPRPPT